MIDMSSPARTPFDIFNKKQLQDNASLLSHVPRDNGTYVHMPTGTVVTRARLGAVDESPNVSRIRRSLFRDRSFDDSEGLSPVAPERKGSKKTNNDSGFADRYRDNSFAYYNRMFLSDTSSDSDLFDSDIGEDTPEWEPMELISKKAPKLVKRVTKNANPVRRKLEKRKSINKTENCSPVAKISKCTRRLSVSVSASATKITEAIPSSSRSNNDPEPENYPVNVDLDQNTKKNNDVEMLSAKMRFADLVFQFHNHVKLREVETDSENEATDISETGIEEGCL